MFDTPGRHGHSPIKVGLKCMSVNDRCERQTLDSLLVPVDSVKMPLPPEVPLG